MTGKGLLVILLGAVVVSGLWLRVEAQHQAELTARFYRTDSGVLARFVRLQRAARELQGGGHDRREAWAALRACDQAIAGWPAVTGHAFQTRALAREQADAVRGWLEGRAPYLETELAYGALVSHLRRAHVRLGLAPAPGTSASGIPATH